MLAWVKDYVCPMSKNFWGFSETSKTGGETAVINMERMQRVCTILSVQGANYWPQRGRRRAGAVGHARLRTRQRASEPRSGNDARNDQRVTGTPMETQEG